MKLSQIERVRTKNLIMKEKPIEGKKPAIEIRYKKPNFELYHMLYKLGNLNKIEKVYKAIFIITDIEVDKDFEWFKNQVESNNNAAKIVLEDVLKEIEYIQKWCEKVIQEAREKELYNNLLEFMYL